jgi:predicted amidohydrolase
MKESSVIALALAIAMTGAWTPWAPRPEIAPKTAEHAGTLEVFGAGNPSAHGGWERIAGGVQPGKWYRFDALYQTANVPYEHLQVTARIEWLDAAGKRAGQPDYAWETKPEGDWKRVSLLVPAPQGAASAKLELYLSNAPNGRVAWKNVSLSPAADPGPRPVRVASINLRPKNTGSREASVAAFSAAIEKELTRPVDLILLPEGITLVGTDKSYADVAETLPGPTTATLSRIAAKHHAWIAAGLYEREGKAIYNTAVLIDREGKLAGKYRKVYLPREEIEGGITPGSSYPTFRTDFGTVGMMICWDSSYADPARGLALHGADLVLVPIWGGNETLMRARAIENRVFIATSGYDYPTQIIDPDGKIIAEAKAQGSAAFTTIDLNRRYLDPWLGDMKQRLRKEVRLDVPAGFE